MDRRANDNSYNRPRVVATKTFQFNRSEPRCYAPNVDPTRARQAYGKRALPKLARELCESDQNVVRQAVTTIADIAVNSEEMIRIIELRIPERIADLLISEDPYLRERVAIIYGTMSRQAAGREAIFKYPKILHHLSTGLLDNLSMVAMKVAQVIESLARNPIGRRAVNILHDFTRVIRDVLAYTFATPNAADLFFWEAAAEDLCEHGFLERLLEVIDSQKYTTLLALHLECLGSLLNNGTVNVNIRAIKINAMEKLVSLLNITKKDDERVLVGTLDCLARLCQEAIGKEKSIEMDLLSIMKKFLNDQRRPVYTKAAAVIVFATITTRGKLRAFELEMIDRLVKLAADTNDREIQLVSIQALTNIAQVPDGKKKLLNEHSSFMENIDTCMDDTTNKFKNVLMEKIHPST